MRYALLEPRRDEGSSHARVLVSGPSRHVVPLDGTVENKPRIITPFGVCRILTTTDPHLGVDESSDEQTEGERTRGSVSAVPRKARLGARCA